MLESPKNSRESSASTETHHSVSFDRREWLCFQGHGNFGNWLVTVAPASRRQWGRYLAAGGEGVPPSYRLQRRSLGIQQFRKSWIVGKVLEIGVIARLEAIRRVQPDRLRQALQRLQIMSGQALKH